MMTQRNKAGRTTVRTETLTPLEEKVVRMRYGLTAPNDMVLDQVGKDDSVVAAQLRDIEEQAIAAVSARKSPAKRKIVSALRRKQR